MAQGKHRQSHRLGSVALSFMLAFSLGYLLMGDGVAQSNQPAPYQQGQVWQQGNAGPQQENILIILDASGSMAEPLDPHAPNGEAKISVAKRSILQVLNAVPGNVNIGMRVYGANTSNRMFACQDTQLMVPIGPQQRFRISSALMDVQPTGSTPISYSLIKAIENDFTNLPGKKTIILVSDGMETCGEDPCDVTVKMQQRGVDVKINVVGFGLQDMAAASQLKCIALSTFGEFHLANTAAQLAQHLGRGLQAQTEVQGKILLPKTPSQPASTSSVQPPKPVKEVEYRL